MFFSPIVNKNFPPIDCSQILEESSNSIDFSIMHGKGVHSYSIFIIHLNLWLSYINKLKAQPLAWPKQHCTAHTGSCRFFGKQ